MKVLPERQVLNCEPRPAPIFFSPRLRELGDSRMRQREHGVTKPELGKLSCSRMRETELGRSGL